MTQQARIIKGPHLLFAGSNGVPTFGILVENTIDSLEECRRRGVAFRWAINDFVLDRSHELYEDYLGVSAEDIQNLLLDMLMMKFEYMVERAVA